MNSWRGLAPTADLIPVIRWVCRGACGQSCLGDDLPLKWLELRDTVCTVRFCGIRCLALTLAGGL